MPCRHGGRLVPGGQASLDGLAAALRLPPADTKAVALSVKQQAINRFLEGLRAKQRLSPAEEQELYRRYNSLGLDPGADKETATLLRRWKYYWSLENGPLIPVTTPMPLHKGEAC